MNALLNILISSIDHFKDTIDFLLNSENKFKFKVKVSTMQSNFCDKNSSI